MLELHAAAERCSETKQVLAHCVHNVAVQKQPFFLLESYFTQWSILDEFLSLSTLPLTYESASCSAKHTSDVHGPHRTRLLSDDASGRRIRLRDQRSRDPEWAKRGRRRQGSAARSAPPAAGSRPDFSAQGSPIPNPPPPL